MQHCGGEQEGKTESRKFHEGVLVVLGILAFYQQNTLRIKQ
jgi:hypothetical protein